MANISVDHVSGVESVQKNQWDNLVAQSNLGTIFHTTDWLAAIEEGFAVQAKHAIIQKEDSLAGIFPNVVAPLELPAQVKEKAPATLTPDLRQISSLNVGYGGPIVPNKEGDLVKLLLTEATRTTTAKDIFHEIRTSHGEFAKYARVFREAGYAPSILNCRIELDLSDGIEGIYSNMDKDRRYNLRKAKEQEFTLVQEDVSTERLVEFYEGYEATMKRVDGNAQPFAFFEALCERMEEDLKLVSAEVDGKKVGSHLYLLDEHQSTVRHMYSSVKEKNFQFYPSELIHDFMIQWGIDNEFDQYDFGGTPADMRDGLFKYKQQYGGEVTPTIKWERGISPFWSLYRRARRAYLTR